MVHFSDIETTKPLISFEIKIGKNGENKIDASSCI